MDLNLNMNTAAIESLKTSCIATDIYIDRYLLPNILCTIHQILDESIVNKKKYQTKLSKKFEQLREKIVTEERKDKKLGNPLKYECQLDKRAYKIPFVEIQKESIDSYIK